jgi:D-alanyl-D-alanine carboxypeptidase/D-alanyl-D-alanine-endopeptidase (penicillin-binding protein 4)
MPRWFRVVCCALWLSGPAAAQQAALPAEVDAALARGKLPRDAVVLLVAPVGPGAARLAHRIDEPVNPASVAKLTTTYAALDLLGPAYTWTTPVYFEGPVRDGVLHGNLYVKGQGDPKLVQEKLWLLLRRIQGLGVRQITGDIVLDRSAFQVPAVDPGAFDGEPLRPYNAAPDALLVNFKSVVLTFTPVAGGVARLQVEPPLAGVGWPATVPLVAGECADWRTALRANWTDPLRPRFEGGYLAACGERPWPVAYADPAAFAGRAIAGMWRDMGGQLTGAVRDGRVPAGLAPAFEWPSPPLAEVVRDVNKFSNNVMAQQLFLTLGWQQRGAGNLDASREVLRAWWRERIGGEPPTMDNGSGLSRTERTTARQLAQLLQVAWASPAMPELVSSLPLAGVDGTMRRRQGSVGQAHLKTGSLNGVAGVAGYVHGSRGGRYILVAIANHPNAPALRPAIDALVAWTAREP